MEDIQKIETPTPEELIAEKEAMVEVKEDEVREAIVSEYGFDEEEDAEKIEKAVEREVKHRKTLSTAIRQKIKYRDSQPKPVVEEVKPVVEEPPKTDKTAEQIVKETFEQRDLDDLEYPDELKDEIKRIAEVQQVSIKKALADPYIVSRIEAHKETVEIEEATISRTNKTGSKVKFSIDKPPKVDMGTEEGQKKWDEYLEWMQKQEGFTAQDSNL